MSQTRIIIAHAAVAVALVGGGVLLLPGLWVVLPASLATHGIVALLTCMWIESRRTPPFARQEIPREPATVRVVPGKPRRPIEP